MKEPQRLLADAETSALSRSLLAAGRARREPDGARERVWSAMAMGVAGGAAGAGASPRGALPALAKAKLVIAGFALLAAASAGVMVMGREASVVTSRGVTTPAPIATNDAKPSSSIVEAPPAAAPEEIASPTEPSPVAPVAADDAKKRIAAARRSEPPPAAVDARPVDTQQAPATTISSKLREEAALLQQARVALGQGDIMTARGKLADARSRFPNSQLGEERDALDVRIAYAAGDRARAASLARAYVERYPESPLRAGVEAMGRDQEKP